MFKPRIHPLRQPAMSPTNVTTSSDKDEEVPGLALGVASNDFGGDTFMLVHSVMVRVAGRSKVTFDKRDDTHKA
jgi:hypothetical protein